MVTRWITMSVSGTSFASAGTFSIASSVSMPCSNLPNTVYLPFRCGAFWRTAGQRPSRPPALVLLAFAYVRKNWEPWENKLGAASSSPSPHSPLVLGPELAIDSVPELVGCVRPLNVRLSTLVRSTRRASRRVLQPVPQLVRKFGAPDALPALAGAWQPRVRERETERATLSQRCCQKDAPVGSPPCIMNRAMFLALALSGAARAAAGLRVSGAPVEARAVVVAGRAQRKEVLARAWRLVAEELRWGMRQAAYLGSKTGTPQASGRPASCAA